MISADIPAAVHEVHNATNAIAAAAIAAIITAAVHEVHNATNDIAAAAIAAIITAAVAADVAIAVEAVHQGIAIIAATFTGIAIIAATFTGIAIICCGFLLVLTPHNWAQYFRSAVRFAAL